MRQIMDRETTLGELVDSIEGDPWIYCGDTLIASPADDLLDLITPVAYDSYLRELGLYKLAVESYEEKQTPTGDYVLNVYLDSLLDVCIVSTERIAEIAKNLTFKYDLTRQQAVIVSFIDLAKLSRASVARLLDVKPQSIGAVYKVAKVKISNQNQS